MVCLGESNRRHAAALLTGAGFAGWGLVLDRQWAWDAGGGPVWYVRYDQWMAVRSSLDPALHSWLVRTEPNDSDWLHEHEWRIPCAQGELVLETEGVRAFLVSDGGWGPPTHTDHMLDPLTGDLVVGEVTPSWIVGIPVYLWDGADLVEMGPIQRREFPWPVQP